MSNEYNSQQFTFFWSSKSPFSQWYPSEFIIDTIIFNCAEQYMMYQKAILFEDLFIAEKILKSKFPKEQKMLGRTVKNFQQKIWDNHCQSIVYKGNYAKFTQNLNLKKHLLKTEGTLLVEASPVDTIWGIGLSAEDPKILDPHQWKGKNYLGKILTKLREDIHKKEKSPLSI